MHGNVENIVLGVEFLLGAISVVYVPIEYDDTFTLFLSCAGSDCDVVEEAETGWF